MQSCFMLLLSFPIVLIEDCRISSYLHYNWSCLFKFTERLTNNVSNINCKLASMEQRCHEFLQQDNEHQPLHYYFLRQHDINFKILQDSCFDNGIVVASTIWFIFICVTLTRTLSESGFIEINKFRFRINFYFIIVHREQARGHSGNIDDIL